MATPSYLPVSTNPNTTTTTTATTTNQNPKSHYSTKAQAYDCCIYLFFIIILAGLLVAAPLVLRGIASLQPETPEFTINSAALTIVNASSTTITANYNVTFTVKNPNGKSLSYDKIVAVILDNGTDQSLSSITLSGFNQPGKTLKTLHSGFSRMSFQVSNCSNGGGNDTVVVPCGAVNLAMEVQAKVKYGGWTCPKIKDLIKVTCEGFKVELPSKANTLSFGSSECDVNGYWKTTTTHFTRIFWGYVFFMVVILGILGVSL